MSAPQGDDLERRLAALFEQRAATVTRARHVDLDSEQGDRKTAGPRQVKPVSRGRLRENLGLIAVAAAVFVAIASTVLGIQAGLDGKGPSYSGGIAAGPNGGNATNGRGSDTIASFCAAPQGWRQAIDAGAVPVDRNLNSVISANSGTGDYLVLQGNEPPSQTSAIYSDIEVALFHGSRGVAIHTPEGSDIPQADPTGAITADWVTFAVARLQDLNPGYHLTYSYKVMLYDRGAGVTRTLVEMPRQQYSPGKSVLGAPVIAAGKVYWLAGVHNKPETTTLESWDLARNSAAGSVPAADATRLVSYGAGVALLLSRDSGTSPFLRNGAGAPLTQAQLDATAGGVNFGFDGVSKLSWVGSDRGLAVSSDLGMAVYSTSAGGGVKVSGEPLFPFSYPRALPAIGQNAISPVVYPFIAVQVNNSDGLLDLRTGLAVVLPAGLTLQAVVGDEVIFGTGATKSGAAGLSRVALSSLPPVRC